MPLDKFWKRSLLLGVSIVITLSLYGQNTNLTAVSAPQELKTGNNKISIINKDWLEGGIFYGFKPEQEETQLRTETSKKFDLGNGIKKVLIGGPFHFQDSNGSFQDINLDIHYYSNDVYGYKNTSNLFISEFSLNNEKGVRMSYKHSSIDFGINTTIYSEEWKPNNNSTNCFAKLSGNKLIYKDIYKDIDLEYEVTARAILHRLWFKERRIFDSLKTLSNYLIVEETMRLPKNAILYDSLGVISTNRRTYGNIQLIVNGDTVFHIAQARIWDATFNGDIFNPGYDKGIIPNEFQYISTELNFIGNNSITLKSYIPYDWILNPNRKFPIVFDPTQGIGGSGSLTYSASGSNVGYAYPWRTNYYQQYTQTIYTGSEIGYTGNITKIEYRQGINNGLNNSNSTILMQESSNSTFSSASFITSGFTSVLSSTTLNYTSGSGSNVSCSSPSAVWRANNISFNYNKSKNLLVQTRFINSSASTGGGTCGSLNGACCIGGGWYYYSTGSNRLLFGRCDCSSTPSANFSQLSPVVIFTINTTCTNWAVSPNTQSSSSSGGNYNAKVSASGSCTYNLSINQSWIHFVSYGSNGVFNYSIDNNSGSARTGTISINDVTNNISGIVTLTINQAGASCSYSISPSSNTSVPVGGNSYNISVSTSSGCSWTASASGYTSWINIYSGSSGTGSGTCYYTVGSNSGSSSSRTGYITIAGHSFTITQAGASCSYSISPSSNTSVPVGGNSYNISVSTSSGCSWTASASGYTSWINIYSGSSGTGSGTCYYTVGSNSGSSSSRTGYITIAGHTFSITQAGTSCTAPSFSKQPGPSDRPEGSSTYFLVSIIGTSPTNRWQFKKPSGSWTDVPNASPYSGIASDKLIIQPLHVKMNGYQFRCVATNNCNVVESKPANLKVTEVKNQNINAINNSSNQKQIAEPIQVGTKTYLYKHTDFNLPVIEGNLSFARYYNSLNRDINSPVGYGWTHSFSFAVQNHGDTVWDVKYPDGHINRFISLLDGTGSSFPLYDGTFDSLVQKNNKDFWLYSKDLNLLKFDSFGVYYQQEDPNGNQTILTYSSGKLTKVTGPGGRALTLTYNSSSQLTSVTSPMGRVCRYGYDSNGDQIFATTPNGDTLKFTYNGHKILTIRDALGNIMLSNIYNSQGDIINQADAYNQNTAFAYNTPTIDDATVTFPDNSKQVFHHDSSFNLIKSIDAMGGVSLISYDNNNPDTVVNELKQEATFTYDSKGNPITQSLPGGKNYQMKFNKYSKPTEITDPKLNKTTYSYDGKGNLLSIKLPDNTDRLFTYNTDGTPKLFINGNGDSTKFFYNSSGDLTQLSIPTGNVRYSYDTDGRIKTITDPRGSITSFTYDNNNNIASIKDALNQAIYFTYDKANQLTSFKNKRKCTTRFYYDKKGRLIARKNAVGGYDSLFYDVQDNLIKWKDALGHETVYTYDKNKRRTSVSNFAGTVIYEYDALGRLIKLIDPNKHITKLGYSDGNMIDSLTDALNQVNRMFYDSTDNLVKRTDYRNTTKKYSYDPLSRLSKVIDVDNEITLYAYDSIGNMKTLTDGNRHIQNFIYGKAGMLKSYKDGAGNRYSFTYDSSGNIKTVTKPVGSLSNTYDALNRLTKVNISSGETYTYTYDENNNITTINNSLGTSYFYYDSLDRMVKYKDMHNKVVQYAYNPVGSVTAIIYPGGDSVLYSYDAANRLIEVKDWKKNVFKYTYDSSGRVTKLTYPTGIHADFIYDATGRILSKFTRYKNDTILYGQSFSYYRDSVIELRWGSYPKNVASENVTNTYRGDDAAYGNSSVAYVNDNNGNRTKEIRGSDTTAYIWSVDQLLLSSKSGGINTFYGYDALGHRVKRKTDSKETRYVLGLNGPLSLVLQTTNSNGIANANNIYGLGLLEQIDSAGNELFYHFDSRHNTIAITNQKDSVKATYTYLLFGVLTEKTGSIDQPFAFLGEFGVEQETNSTHYVRARYYDALSGRFLSKDPLFGNKFEPQSHNKYVYSLNNPFENHDVNGFYSNKDYANASMQLSGSYLKIAEVLNEYDNAKLFSNYESIKNSDQTIKAFNVRPAYTFENVGTGLSIAGAGIETYSNINDFNEGKIDQTTLFLKSGSTELGLASKLVKNPIANTSLGVAGAGLSTYSDIREYNQGNIDNTQLWTRGITTSASLSVPLYATGPLGALIAFNIGIWGYNVEQAHLLYKDIKQNGW